MCPTDIQVWQIKRTVRGGQIHSIHHGSNQSTMAIDTALTPTVVQLKKKSCITADDDPLCCEIDFSQCTWQISNYGQSNEPSEAGEATAFTVARIRVPWRYKQRKHQRGFGFRRKVASQQMMILSAVRSISRDVPSRYPSMVDQMNHQKQTKPQHSPWFKSNYHGDRYKENTDGGSVSEEKLNHT
jgi:hypothetical protein